MVIFHSYVSLPEGKSIYTNPSLAKAPISELKIHFISNSCWLNTIKYLSLMAEIGQIM